MLRKPLALPHGSEQDEMEKEAFHIAAYDGQQIVGVGRLHAEPGRAARVRYMAVREGYRHRGIGSSILRQLEQYARDHRVQICWLYARETAVGFYAKNGYTIQGQGKSELSAVHHERMQKHLA